MPIDTEAYAKKVEGEIEKFLEKVLIKLESESVRILYANNKIAWGVLVNGVTHEVYKEAAKIVGVYGVRENVASVSHEMGEGGYSKKFPYAIVVHEGSRPHWPPQIAIQQWVIRKGIVKMNKRPITFGKLQGAKKSVSDPVIREIKQIAFLIARKISKKGTKGLPFLRMALNQNRSWIEGELSKLKLS